MDFCWYNTVNIYPKESDNGHGMIKYFGEAKITTEGDVGPCYQIKTDPIIPIKPIIPQFINELADIPVEPLLKGKNEAIVSMPKIGVDETAKGKVFVMSKINSAQFILFRMRLNQNGRQSIAQHQIRQTVS